MTTPSPRLPPAYLSSGSSSFTEFAATAAPHVLPGSRPLGSGTVEAPHGTTIVALVYADGVLVAGDRRATVGTMIANRDMDKVFAADDYALVGIAGAAGLALELVRLFQVELEHYEKLEGAVMSIEGKANRLSSMLKGNLGLAMQGLAVVPLLAGLDLANDQGRIFSYDVTGGCYEETDYHCVGSGSVFARGAIKKLYRADMSANQAMRVALEALYDAADDDSATGGPDVARRIWPRVALADREGSRFVPAEDVGAVAADVIDGRRDNPGGGS